MESVGGSESILVVDDDPVQRAVAQEVLQSLGYRVSTAASGEEAVAAVTAEPVDLVILDMIMPPGIDGAETYRRIRKGSPSQAAILVSGFAESDRVLMAQELGAGAFIRKPATRGRLAAAVRAELDRQHSPH
jgi:CheY-like chemotaxis protein